RFLKDTKGAAAIEFAIAMVPVAILLTGSITYAGVFSMRIALQNAANAAVRAGIAGASTCERESLATATARSALTLGDAAHAEVNVVATDDTLRVTIRYPYAAGSITPVMMPIPNT